MAIQATDRKPDTAASGAGRRCSVRDLFSLTKRSITDEGFLVAPANLARTGVQVYTAGELGLDVTDGIASGKAVRLHRPAEEVFSPETLASFEAQTVTDNHPREPVSASSWSDVAVGDVTAIACDGKFMTGKLIVRDAAAIKAIQSGKDELSMGYSFVLDMTPGTTADGQPYDGIQRQIRGNHAAIVDFARGGSALRIADAAAVPQFAVGDRVTATADHMPGMKGTDGTVALVENGPYYGVRLDGMPGVHKWLAQDELVLDADDDASVGSAGNSATTAMDKRRINTGDHMSIKKIVVDGLTLELDETQAGYVEKVVGDAGKAAKAANDTATAAVARAEKAEKALADEQAKTAKLVTDHAAALKDVEAQVIKPEALEALVAERTKVVGDAKALAPELKSEGKTVPAIRVEALTVVMASDEAAKKIATAGLGGVELSKADPAIVRAVFDTVVAAHGTVAADDSASANTDIARAMAGDSASTGSRSINAEKPTGRDAYIAGLSTAYMGNKNNAEAAR